MAGLAEAANWAIRLIHRFVVLASVVKVLANVGLVLFP